jgi:glutaconate CoA-transferase subunit B
MTQATHFSEREHQICAVAHMVEDARTYWVTGGGSPMAAILLAKKLYAPDAVYVTEDGVLGAEPALPFDPIMNMVSSRAGYRALQWGTMNTVGFHAQIGLMDYGILNTLQVDQWGNINSTAVGDYEGEHRRFGGPGGARPAPARRRACPAAPGPGAWSPLGPSSTTTTIAASASWVSPPSSPSSRYWPR